MLKGLILGRVAANNFRLLSFSGKNVKRLILGSVGAHVWSCKERANNCHVGSRGPVTLMNMKTILLWASTPCKAGLLVFLKPQINLSFMLSVVGGGARFARES